MPDCSKYTRLYLWLRFICNDDFVCFSLSCDGLLAVFVTIHCLQSKTILRLGFVMEDNVYSLCLAFYNCTFMNHTVPDK